MRKKDRFDELAEGLVFGDGALRNALLDGNDGELANRLADRLREVGQADARALWAVRVLDAWARQSKGGWWEFGPGALECLVRLCPPRGKKLSHLAKTEDAARHAAAQAVFPSLDATTRERLGECP